MKVDRLYDAEDHLSPLGATNGTRVVPANTILFVVRGMILAKEFPVVLAKRPVAFNQDLKAVRCADFADTEFLYYWLKANSYEILGRADEAGHGTKRLQTDRLLSLPIHVPPLRVQRRIAEILSAYDNLIENNLRRIRILEETARTLYREWFVHFRFPGYEKVPSVSSPLGPIPKGWEVKRLVDFCHLTMGQSPKSEFYNETGKGQPFHQGVTDFGERFPTDRLFCTAEGRIAEAGDILFSVRAPVGRLNIADKRIVIGRGLSSIRHKAGHQAFLWEQLRARFTTDDMMGNGAIFAAVTKSDVQDIELLCPPDSLIRAATSHIGPAHAQVEILAKQITNLRRTRDLLLPRLLSGQIKTYHLE